MSDELGLILPSGGDEGTPLVIVPWGGAVVAAWPGIDQGIFVKFQVAKARTVTGLRIGVGAASGNAKAGLYSNDGTNLTQMGLSASTPVAGTNATQDILFIAAQQVTAGLVYAAFLVLDNATATLLRTTTASSGFAKPGAFDVSAVVTSAFTTPPTPQAIAGLGGASSGYTPILALI